MAHLILQSEVENKKDRWKDFLLSSEYSTNQELQKNKNNSKKLFVPLRHAGKGVIKNYLYKEKGRAGNSLIGFLS